MSKISRTMNAIAIVISGAEITIDSMARALPLSRARFRLILLIAMIARHIARNPLTTKNPAANIATNGNLIRSAITIVGIRIATSNEAIAILLVFGDWATSSCSDGWGQLQVGQLGLFSGNSVPHCVHRICFLHIESMYDDNTTGSGFQMVGGLFLLSVLFNCRDGIADVSELYAEL